MTKMLAKICLGLCARCTNVYKSYFLGHELKRKLCQEFDLFFVDSRISRLVSPHLGSEFYKRRKVPFNIRMENKNTMKFEMENALKSAQVKSTFCHFEFSTNIFFFR